MLFEFSATLRTEKSEVRCALTSAAKAIAISSELDQRGVSPDTHQPVVADAGAPERHDRLDERGGEREHKGEMADLDNHCVAAVVPSCQRPCFLSASTTSRGM